MNQTLMGMVIEVMIFKFINSIFLVEPLHTFIYLRNRSPSSYLDGITPFEAWCGFKQKIKHLKTYGLVWYFLIPKEKRTKSDSRSMISMMIQCSKHKNGNRTLSDGKLVISWAVIFDETKITIAEGVNKLLS